MVLFVALASLGQRSAVVTFARQSAQIDPAPITMEARTIRGVKFFAITGGKPGSRLINRRQPVRSFIRDANAQAGINGAFFVMAAIRSQDSAMIGPVVSETGPRFVPCRTKVNGERLEGRPLVLWDGKTVVIAPYALSMNTEEGIDSELPGATGGFVAGAWLVQDGRALTSPEIKSHGPRDAEQPRHRAMFGVTESGRICLMAAAGSVASSRLAQAAVEFGCKSAVLLDSGFSTSLVYGDQTLVSGHSTSKTPSRPVPHALVLYGSAAGQ